MKDNTYEFMILTGKYLPDENIQSNDPILFFNHYDPNGKEIYYENSDGYWSKTEYNEQGKVIYEEESDGYWFKREYNSEGKPIYHEDSIQGIILDER